MSCLSRHTFYQYSLGLDTTPPNFRSDLYHPLATSQSALVYWSSLTNRLNLVTLIHRSSSLPPFLLPGSNNVGPFPCVSRMFHFCSEKTEEDKYGYIANDLNVGTRFSCC